MANTRLTSLQGVSDKFIIIDANLTAVGGDKAIAKVGGVTVTLPSATKHGMEVAVKNVGTEAVTVARAGTDLINAVLTSFSIAANKTWKFIVSTEGFWVASNYTATDEYVAKRIGDSFVYVNLKEGDKPLIQSVSELK